MPLPGHFPAALHSYPESMLDGACAQLSLVVSDLGSIRAEVLPARPHTNSLPPPPPSLPARPTNTSVSHRRHHSVIVNSIPSRATQGARFLRLILASFFSYAKFLPDTNSSLKLLQRIINSASKLHLVKDVRTAVSPYAPGPPASAQARVALASWALGLTLTLWLPEQGAWRACDARAPSLLPGCLPDFLTLLSPRAGKHTQGLEQGLLNQEPEPLGPRRFDGVTAEPLPSPLPLVCFRDSRCSALRSWAGPP